MDPILLGLLGLAGASEWVGRRKKAWARIKQGMSCDQVRAILGDPQRVENTTLSGISVTVWRYIPRGRVTFADGVVDSWITPVF